jgi:hypothetical protein
MSYEYVDGRGGAREGSGRPKLDEVKKAFRVTVEEKNLVKLIRRLKEEEILKLKSQVKETVSKSSFFN